MTEDKSANLLPDEDWDSVEPDPEVDEAILEAQEEEVVYEDEVPRPERSPAPKELREIVIEIARLIKDSKGYEIIIFDVSMMSDLTHYVVVATGTSDRQIKSVGEEVKTFAKRRGLSPFGKDVDQLTTWLALDLVDVMVHLFEPETRTHYDLEMMWDDAPRVEWLREGERDRSPHAYED